MKSNNICQTTTEFHPYAINSIDQLLKDYQIYNSERIKALQYQSHVITTYSTSPNQFNILPVEWAGGKTLTLYYIISTLYKLDKDNTGTVILKKFDNEVDKTVKEINKLTGEKTAIGLISNSDKYKDLTEVKEWNNFKNKASKYHTVVTTHSRYEKLLLTFKFYKYLGKYNDKPRRNLIIDEFIDIVNKFTLSENILSELSEVIPVVIIQNYWKLIEPIINELNLYSTQSKKSFYGKFFFNQSLFNTIETVIKNNDLKKNKESFTKAKVLRLLDNIKEILKHGGVINNNFISSYNRNLRLIGLNNNLILDANAGFDYRYVLNEQTNILPQSKFRDYSKGKLTVYYIGTSINKLKNTPDYFDIVIKMLNEETTHTLAVIQNEFVSMLEENITNKNVEINHFYNLLGKNDYKNFDKVYLLGTPRLDSSNYILNYYYYTNKEYDKKISLEMGKKDGTIGFNNKDVDKLRIGCTAGELLQCAMRICRTTDNFTGHILLFTKDDGVTDLIQKQLSEININTKFIAIESDKNKNPKINSWQKLIQEVSKLSSGIYTKNEIRGKIDFKKKNNFSKILLHHKVLSYFKSRSITIDNNHIFIP